MIRLNLGCGSRTPSSWVNVDYSVGARLARVPVIGPITRRLRLFNMDWDDSIVLHDLTRPFPWPDSSVQAVYSSHTLEHMTRTQGRRFLVECHRVLVKGGVLRILVPDLRYEVEQYLSGEVVADEFVERLGVLYAEGQGTLKSRLAPLIQYPHKCMYDTERLLAVLQETGFDSARRRPFESDIGDISDIELIERTTNAVIVEGCKPRA